MFERRLRILSVAMSVALLILVVRLTQLQIVQGAHYRKAASRVMTLTPKPLPFVRGSILDRTGEVLVQEEPSWDLCIDFDVIASDVGDVVVTASAAGNDRAAMWQELAQFSDREQPNPVRSLQDRARAIYDRIKRVRRVVKARRGFDAPVAEELVPQAVVRSLNAEQQIAARELLSKRYPWVHVEPASTRRCLGDGAPFSHLLGRLGSVDADDVDQDPNADDPFAKYRADERIGISGVELLAENALRGRRGQITTDRDGIRLEEECFPAENGRDVVLTIHAELQRRLFRLVGDAVEAVPESSGGAVVVLDIPSREVLALVSYPSYDPNRFSELYPDLRNDTKGFPLRFRAVANTYAPGSTIKPLTCLAALDTRHITLNTRETCTGYLFPHLRNKWRCWPIMGTSLRKAHGAIHVVEALIGSCNVFMYRLGERLGVDALCNAFDMVGIGKPTGTGLIEEAWGLNPTSSWLMSQRNVVASPGRARLFAIGQGELLMTPIQVANLMATYASGRFRYVSLIRGESETPEWTLPGEKEHWDAIRRGIYGVVNDPGGTAYKYARLEHDRYVLCGKTGSATTKGWPTSYVVPYLDEYGTEREEIVPAGARKSAIKRFTAEHPGVEIVSAQVQIASRWPTVPPSNGAENHAHAWFAGYLQETDATGQPNWSKRPRIAFAVLVEFGGSGGRVTGPLARQIAEDLPRILGPELDVNASNFTSGLP